METIIPDARPAILMEDVQHERLDDVDTGKTNNF
jgi:hypothetical protein